MADKVIISKSKMISLADAIRAKTGSTAKMTIDTMNAALDNIGGGGSNIIEVSELPTENIDENAIYKIPSKFFDVYIELGTFGGFTLGQDMNIIGAEVLETKPTDNIVSSSLSTYTVYLYYITGENDIFVYGNVGAGDMWYTVGQVYSLLDGPSIPFQGELIYGEVPTNIGYYAYFDKERYYKASNNVFSEISTVNDILERLFNNELYGRLEFTRTDYHSIGGNFTLERSKFEYIKMTIRDPRTDSAAFEIYNDLFYECSAKTIYLSNTNRNAYLMFYSSLLDSCKNLTKLVLDFGSFQSSSADLLVRTPIAEGNGYIYIPDDKVEEVKTIYPYSNYASQIKPLSEYVEE